MHNNKIFQSSFGLVMLPIFPAIKKGCSVNKKWLFCEKNHLLFSDQVQIMSLSHIAKNGPQTQFCWKLADIEFLKPSLHQYCCSSMKMHDAIFKEWEIHAHQWVVNNHPENLGLRDLLQVHMSLQKQLSIHLCMLHLYWKIPGIGVQRGPEETQ